jgi:glycosyltransferase involved in cell wall biosynthesis
MNIAITSLYLPSGSKIGVGYQVHGLANALVSRGHDVTVFSPCQPPENAKYEVSVVPPGRRFRTFGFAWDLRHINFDRFDVLNAHGDDWFLWGVRRPRHIHTFHGSCFAEMFNIDGFKAKARMGLLAVCEAQAVFLADETVAVSENTRRYIGGIQNVIPCGVDLGVFAPAITKSAYPSILFVGTMHGRKRGQMLVEIFRREIQIQIPEAELWCVCDKPANMPLTSGVRWFGRISEAQLAELYGKAWIFCLPSTYEGFGVPYIEAMASGAAVVATRNPGAIEVTSGGKFGLLEKDSTLGGGILSLLMNPNRRNKLTLLGIERAKDFSWDSVCERYEALYRGVRALEVAE